MAGLIDAVGTAIRSAAPRHLIGVHLAGASPLAEYDQFQGKPWLNLQVFQSGSGNNNGTCGILGTNSNPYARWVCRARSFALRFRCIGEPTSNATCTDSGAPTGEPVKPAVNVEGQYEELGNNLTRVQSRHIGWNSGLSGSQLRFALSLRRRAHVERYLHRLGRAHGTACQAGGQCRRTVRGARQ